MTFDGAARALRSVALAALVGACAQSLPVTPSGAGGSTGGGGGSGGSSAQGAAGVSGGGGSSIAGSGAGDAIGTGGQASGTGGNAGDGGGGASGTGGSSGAGGSSAGAGGAAGTSGQAGAAGRGTGQAGASGSGGTGTGGGASPASCPAGALLCEDFETFTANAPPNGRWSARTNGTATVVVDTTHARSGTKAVHFHSSPVNNSQRAYILAQGAPVFPVAGDRLYVRFMLYIGRYISVSGTSIHNRIAWVGAASTLSSGGNGPGYSFATYNGITIERLTNPNQGFQRDTSQHLDDVSRQGKWQCFEFEIDNKGGVPPGEQSSSTVMPHIWQEGTELKLAAAGSSEAWLPVPFEALQFSLWCPQTDPMATDYWIDDVVMSTERIKCPEAP